MILCKLYINFSLLLQRNIVMDRLKLLLLSNVLDLNLLDALVGIFEGRLDQVVEVLVLFQLLLHLRADFRRFKNFALYCFDLFPILADLLFLLSNSSLGFLKSWRLLLIQLSLFYFRVHFIYLHFEGHCWHFPRQLFLVALQDFFLQISQHQLLLRLELLGPLLFESRRHLLEAEFWFERFLLSKTYGPLESLTGRRGILFHRHLLILLPHKRHRHARFWHRQGLDHIRILRSTHVARQDRAAPIATRTFGCAHADRRQILHCALSLHSCLALVITLLSRWLRRLGHVHSFHWTFVWSWQLGWIYLHWSALW